MTTGANYRWVSRATAGRPHENPHHHPHVPGGREHRRRSRPGPARPRPTSWWSTTPAPTAPRTWPRPPAGAGPGRRAGPPSRGLGGAYRAGFKHAFAEGYEVVVQMDADLSHPPERLPRCWARSTRAPTSPSDRATCPGPHHQLAVRAHRAPRRQLLRLDRAGAGRARRHRVPGLPGRHPGDGRASATKATGYGFQLELSYRAHRLGSRIVEVPITFNDRVRGVSKMSWHIIGEAMSLVTWWGLRDRVLRRGRAPSPCRLARNRPRSRSPRAAATPDRPRRPRRRDHRV